MDYSEILRKMLMGATPEAPPVSPPSPTDAENIDKMLAESYGSPKAVVAPAKAPPAPQAQGPAYTLVPGVDKDVTQNTREVSQVNKRSKDTTTTDTNQDAKALYAQIKELMARRPELDQGALAQAQDQDRGGRLLQNIGLATSTLAKATSGNKVNGDAFWNQLDPKAEATLQGAFKNKLGAHDSQIKQYTDLLSQVEKFGGTKTAEGADTQSGLKTGNLEQHTTAEVPLKANTGRGVAGRGGFSIPHFTRRTAEDGTPLVYNTPREEADLKKQMSGAATLWQNGKKLLEMLEKDGPSAVMPGERKGEISTRYKTIITKLRLAAGMGAPQAAEMVALAEQLEDPTKVAAALKEYGGMSGVIQQLKTNLELSREDTNSLADAMGFDNDEANPWWAGIKDVSSPPQLGGTPSTIKLRPAGTNAPPREFPADQAQQLLKTKKFEQVP